MYTNIMRDPHDSIGRIMQNTLQKEDDIAVDALTEVQKAQRNNLLQQYYAKNDLQNQLDIR